MLDLSNKKFGKLTVAKHIENRMCECICDCGTIKNIAYGSIVSGRSISCGKCQISELINKKFNKLTVIKFLGKENRNFLWLCECDCGNTINVTTANLRQGRIKSCGCFHAKAAILENKRFGKLVVVKMSYLKNHDAYWLCKCDCGNETELTTTVLNSGQTVSCGCERQAKLINKKVGKLTVVKMEYIKNGVSYWLCKCDCGNEKILSRRSLSLNRSQSCGCSRRDNSIINKVFGQLTVIKYDCMKSKNAYWLCKCSCGNEKVICGVHLKTGCTRSCGCAHNISQTTLTNIVKDIINKDNFIIKTNYILDILYNKKTKSYQQIDIAIIDKDNNIVLAIEYDGQQHFEPIGFGCKDKKEIIKTFERQKNRDNRKNKILKKYNINLIRIPYTEPLNKDNIILILKHNSAGFLIT